MNYLQEFAEFSVIQKQEDQEALLHMAINETNALLGVYSLNELYILQEGIMASIKEKFKKLIEKIKELWARFIDRMTSIFDKKIKWLEKHEDAVRKPVKIDLVYDMYPYYPDGDAMIKKIIIPPFDFERMKESGELESDKAFLNKHFPELIDNEVHYSQVALLLFKGGKNKDVERIDYKDKSMFEYYTYCKNFETRSNAVKKEKDALINSLEKISSLVANIGYDKDKEAKEKTEVNADVSYVGSVLFENTIYVNAEKFGYDYLDDIEKSNVDKFKIAVINTIVDNYDDIPQLLSTVYENIISKCIIDNIPTFKFNFEDFYVVSFNTAYCMLNFIIQQMEKYPNHNFNNIMSITSANLNKFLCGNEIVMTMFRKLRDDYNRIFFASNDTNYILNNILTEAKKEVTKNYSKLSKEETKIVTIIEKTYAKPQKDERVAGEIVELIGKVVQAVLIKSPTVILGVGVTMSFVGAITILGILAGLLLLVTDVTIAINVIFINNAVAHINKLKRLATNVRESEMVDNILNTLSHKKKSLKEEYTPSISKILLEAPADDAKDNEDKIGTKKENPNGNDKPTQVVDDKKAAEPDNTPDNSKDNLKKVVSSSDDTKIVTRYQEICSSILTAKMTALDEANKTYLGILEKHVRSYIGNEKLEKTETGKPKQVNTDAKKDEQPQGIKDGYGETDLEDSKGNSIYRLVKIKDGKKVEFADFKSDRARAKAKDNPKKIKFIPLP